MRRKKKETFDDLGLVAEVGGDVGGTAGPERAANGAPLFVGVELDGRSEIGDADPPVAGAEEHLDQVAGGEASAAGDHAPPLAFGFAPHFL